MNQDFSELIEYLDGKFNRVEGEIRDLKEGFVTLQTSVDEYAKRQMYIFKK